MKRVWEDGSDVKPLKLIRCEEMYFLHHECRVRPSRKWQGWKGNGLDSENGRGQHFAGINHCDSLLTRLLMDRKAFTLERIRQMNLGVNYWLSVKPSNVRNVGRAIIYHKGKGRKGAWFQKLAKAPAIRPYQGLPRINLRFTEKACPMKTNWGDDVSRQPLKLGH
jgi:hypothetical protein